ncbi:MAG: hypothetical protein WC777_01760 [Candidatus Gracilibacteria bacterium]
MKSAEEAHAEIDQIFGTLQGRVRDLEDAIKSSFLLESLDELNATVKQAMELSSICNVTLSEIEGLLAFNNIELARHSHSSLQALIQSPYFAGEDAPSLAKTCFSLAGNISSLVGSPSEEKGAIQRWRLNKLKNHLSMCVAQFEAQIDAFLQPKLKHYFSKLEQEEE